MYIDPSLLRSVEHFSQYGICEINEFKMRATCCRKSFPYACDPKTFILFNRLLGSFDGSIDLGAFGIEIIRYALLLIQRRLRDKTDCKILIFYRFSLANALSKRVQVIDESSAFK